MLHVPKLNLKRFDSLFKFNFISEFHQSNCTFELPRRGLHHSLLVLSYYILVVMYYLGFAINVGNKIAHFFIKNEVIR